MRGPAPNLERGKAAPSADSAPAPVDTKAAEEAAKKAEEEATAAGYVPSPLDGTIAPSVLTFLVYLQQIGGRRRSRQCVGQVQRDAQSEEGCG